MTKRTKTIKRRRTRAAARRPRAAVRRKAPRIDLPEPLGDAEPPEPTPVGGDAVTAFPEGGAEVTSASEPIGEPVASEPVEAGGLFTWMREQAATAKGDA